MIEFITLKEKLEAKNLHRLGIQSGIGHVEQHIRIALWLAYYYFSTFVLYIFGGIFWLFG